MDVISLVHNLFHLNIARKDSKLAQTVRNGIIARN